MNKNSLEELHSELERKARRITDVRLCCLQQAVTLLERGQLPSDPAKDAIDLAKKLETYAWGGHMPNMQQINPLGSIKECADEALMRLNEMIDNWPEGSERVGLLQARAQWERFTADLQAALGERFS